VREYFPAPGFSMAINKIFKAIKENIITFIIACALFFNLAHFLINYWAQPARIMIITFAVSLPLFIGLLTFLKRKTESQLCEIPKKRIIFLAFFSMFLGIILTIAFPHRFTTSVLISPVISKNQKIELLELKANRHALPLSEQAAWYGWTDTNGILTATQTSQPLLVKLNTPINAPVSLLFTSSPDSGSVTIAYGLEKKELTLDSSVIGEAIYSFSTRYRNFPNWLFMPFLVICDILAFSFYALMIFLLQEKGQRSQTEGETNEIFFSHGINLAILLSISVALHIISAFSVPLIMDVDSPSFLRGAIHLVNFGNLDGVNMFRGPGTTFLFAPVYALFGRNPWGMKLLLHTMAIACVGLNYRLAWQLSGKRWIAFITGFATLLLPDLFFFSNFVMSDLPNVFFISLFSTLLISALQTHEKRWIYSSFLVASFAILLRSENLVLLALGIAVLAAQPLWDKVKNFRSSNPDKEKNQLNNRYLGTITLAALIAILPVLWWSAHNYIKFGFFGMSNYAGEVFYTGWVYYGEASGLHVTDLNSPAVKEIQNAIKQYPIEHLNSSGVPTGWNIYPSLISTGHTSSQAFEILAAAARDSIKNSPQLAWEILWTKLKDGLTPRTTHMITFSLPGEAPQPREIESQFFDPETQRIPSLIMLQRGIYTITQFWYDHFYQLIVWAGLFAAYFSLLRKPTLIWGTVVLIMLTRIFIPDIMGKADWRYTISGLVLMITLLIACVSSLGYGVLSVVHRWNKA
jgi:hypothetical protein